MIGYRYAKKSVTERDAHFDTSTGWREFRCVRQQVREHLIDTIMIDMQCRIRQLRGDDNGNIALCRERPFASTASSIKGPIAVGVIRKSSCPASSFSMSRILLIRRMRRSELRFAISIIERDFSGTSPVTPLTISPSAPFIEVSGVRNSWLTVAIKSAFICSSWTRSEMSCPTTSRQSSPRYLMISPERSICLSAPSFRQNVVSKPRTNPSALISSTNLTRSSGLAQRPSSTTVFCRASSRL